MNRERSLQHCVREIRKSKLQPKQLLGALRSLWFLLTLCASLPVFADTTVALVVGVPNPGPCPFECAFLNHVVSGSSFDLVVVAEGQSGGTNPSYTGTVTFRSTD